MLEFQAEHVHQLRQRQRARGVQKLTTPVWAQLVALYGPFGQTCV